MRRTKFVGWLFVALGLGCVLLAQCRAKQPAYLVAEEALIPAPGEGAVLRFTPPPGWDLVINVAFPRTAESFAFVSSPVLRCPPTLGFDWRADAKGGLVAQGSSYFGEASRGFSVGEVDAAIGYLLAQSSSTTVTMTVGVHGTPSPGLPAARVRVVLEPMRHKRETIGAVLRSVALYLSGAVLGVLGLASILRFRRGPDPRAA